MGKDEQTSIETPSGETAPDATSETSFEEYRKSRTAGETPTEKAGEQKPTEKQDTSEAKSESGAGSDGEPETPKPTQDGEEGKTRKHTAEQRIRELTRKRREAEARAQELEERLAAATSGKTDAKEKPASAGPPAKPKAETFDSYDAYEDALETWREQMVDYKVDQKLARVTAEQKANEQTQGLAKAWETRSDAAREKHADYDEVLAENTTELPAHVTQALFESESGPELAYHLASHPEELDELIAKTPVACIKALGVLESTLTAPPKTKTGTTSKAPPPPKPVGAGKSAPSLESVKDFAEYRRLRRQQEQAG